MSEIPHPTSDIVPPAPADQVQDEITPQDIAGASAETIYGAAQAHSYNARTQLASTSSPLEKETFRKQMAEASATMRLVDEWDETEDFEDFLAKRLTEQDAPPAALDAAHRWVGTDTYNLLVRDELRAAAEREASEATATKQAAPIEEQRQPDTVEIARQETEKQRAIAEALDSVEQARGLEVFDDVVKLGKSKTHITSGSTKGFRELGDAPRETRVMIVESLPKKARQEAERNPDWRQHLNEAVSFLEVVKPDMQAVEVPVTVKGRFGQSKSSSVTEMRSVPGSEHPVLVRNERTGQDEPTVRFQYNFQYSVPALSSRELPSYNEVMGNRDGNLMAVGIDLPKSVADKLQAQVQRDPASARLLVERLYLENNDGSVSETDWRGAPSRHPARPPYDGLPNDWNIAVVTGTLSDRDSYTDLVSHQVQRLPAQAAK